MFASAACAQITPNIQNVLIALMARRSLDNSPLESDINLYQLRGIEKLTKSDDTGKQQRVIIELVFLSGYFWIILAKKKPYSQPSSSTGRL